MDAIAEGDLRGYHLGLMFDSAGWKLFEDELDALKEDLSLKMEQMLDSSDYFDAGGLASFNYLRARKYEINRILLTAEALKEEANSPTKA